MGDPVTLALISAGVGGGTTLLRGGDFGSALKNAAIGGATGYAGGALGNAIKGAGAAGAGQAEATSANASGNFLAPTVGEVGMANSFNLATNAPVANSAAGVVGSTGEIGANMGLVNPMAATDLSPMVTRAGQGISSGGLALRNSGEAMAAPSFFDGMSDYLTPQNLMGVSNLMQQGSQAPQMSSVGGGGVRGGNAQTGEGVEEFLRRMGARVQSPQRRQGLFY